MAAVDERPTARPGWWVDERAVAWVAPVVGLVVRVAFALDQGRAEPGGDAYYFHHQANLLADGKGFINPLVFFAQGVERAAADHPPLYSTYLALWSLLGVDTPLGHRLASALLGTATVVLVGLAARRLGGARVGVLAGTAAALHPNLWLWDGRMLSESASAFTVALFLFLVVRFLEAPGAARLATVGASVGLAALGRSEMALLVVTLVPLALRLPREATADTGAGDARDGAAAASRLPGWAASRVGGGVLALVAAGAVVLPWSAHNQARFAEPVPLSTGAGLVLVSSNCDLTYGGDLIGYWSFVCSVEGNDAAGTTTLEDASVTDRKLRDEGVGYARDHADRLPLVALARLGRVTALYRPLQQVALLEQNEGVPSWVGELSVGTWYVLAGLAVVGVRALRRAGVPVAGLVAPVVVVLVVAVAVYGIWRFRAPGDVAVCLLAGVGADAVVRSRLDGGRGAPGGLMAPAAPSAPPATSTSPARDTHVVRRRSTPSNR